MPAIIYSNQHQAPGQLFYSVNEDIQTYFLVIAFFNYSYRAVLDKYGKEVARSTLFFLLGSCGMYVAAPAYLPSSFSMYCCMIIVGAWLQKNYEVCCLCETSCY